MMFVLLASGLGLLALPGLARPMGRRLHPAEWSKLCMVAVAGGALVVELTALFYAAPTLAKASRLPGFAQLCERMLGEMTPGGRVAGGIATAMSVMLPLLGSIGWVRARRVTRQSHVEPELGRHRPHGGHELVVLPTAHLVAVSVPAVPEVGPGQIIVSDGLVDSLETHQLDAVLRHEAAHLRHAHHRYLLTASLVEHAFAWFPWARKSTATLRLSLERWADEDAASEGADRSVVRDALLAVTASLVATPPVAAFSAAETIGERLEALDAPAPRPALAPHLLLYCPGAVLGVTVVAASSWWVSAAGHVFTIAGHCVR